MTVVLRTDQGDIHMRLHVRQCPRASFNFLALCASGYYDGTVFHRNIPKFILQGGDPTGTGKGGAAIYEWFRQAEMMTHGGPSPHAVIEGGEETASHSSSSSSPAVSKYFPDEGFGETFHSQRGVLSMAHRGSKSNTNASQFFITYAPQSSFDGVYTAFGVVTDGNDVLDRIESLGENSKVVLRTCDVLYNPFAVGDARLDPKRV